MKLELHNLEKIYCGRKGDVQALLPTSFTVGSGEFVSFIGPSGCGKSTTLFMIAGLDSPTRGEILLDGARWRAPAAIGGWSSRITRSFPGSRCWTIPGSASTWRPTAITRVAKA